jgi:hypothetical protein
MIEKFSLDLNLPVAPESQRHERPRSSEENDAWIQRERLIRYERGDFTKSDKPVAVPFVFKD